MDFEEFLPETEEIEISENQVEKITSNQFYDIIANRKSDWQSIIYELIQTNQLDPWDIDLIILTKKYFEKIEELEETDYYVSSKILLAAALLLRIKSEFLLNKHIKSIDEILFGKKEPIKTIEKIEIEESEIPILIPKTPLSRLRKVTLPELMAALNKAIETESRRIKREILIKRAKKLSEVDITVKKIFLRDRIKQLYDKILTLLKKPEINKISYSKLVGDKKEEKISAFLPILYLSDNKKVWIEQNTHLDEIWIYLYKHFETNREKFLGDLEQNIEEMKQEIAEIKNEKKINEITEFSEEN